MLRFRVIPCLLLSDGALVKSTRFKNPKYIGDPINTIKIFNESEADEIIILDIDASKKRVPPNYDLISKIASECFMPICYGGGVNSIQIASQLFTCGVEKLSFNMPAMHDPNLIQAVIERFGGQSVVISMDIARSFLGTYSLFSYIKKSLLKKNPIDAIYKFQNMGVGEILLNFVDRDGVMSGYDFAFLEKIPDDIFVPVIVLGGAGHFDDIMRLYKMGFSAASASSLFIYQGPNRAVLINYPDQYQVESFYSE